MLIEQLFNMFYESKRFELLGKEYIAVWGLVRLHKCKAKAEFLFRRID